MKKRINHAFLYFAIATLMFNLSCTSKQSNYNFNNIHDRHWVGREFWTIPIEDWKVESGKVICAGEIADMRMNLLTKYLNGNGNFKILFRMGEEIAGSDIGTYGIRIGIQDNADNKDIRSLCYYGDGIDIGINTSGLLFIDNKQKELPKDFDYSDIKVSISYAKNNLLVTLTDINNISATMQEEVDEIKGIISFISQFPKSGYFDKAPKYWFDDLSLSGTMVKDTPENSFGPILFSMYTLSKGTMKISTQLPPIGEKDNQWVKLQLQRENEWEDIEEKEIEKDARIALFKIEDWDDTKDYSYRLVYEETYPDGTSQPFYYEGTIRKNPTNKEELKVAGMTCQHSMGYPYRPLAENITKSNPDLLYFSGDQIYEENGGYGIVRFPTDRAILNYLGKWYMFGWVFGDIMRDRPTICIPDDHEVYQGNLWGSGGKKVDKDVWDKETDCISGFVEPKEMIQVVMRTNSAHLPDPYDPAPMKQGIDVYYTDVLYGRLSFAIVGDRIFKSGPEEVSYWEGRKDHIKKPLKDPSILDKNDLKLLGDRQILFLEHWMKDWKGADMKVLLTQTIFANASTHHGGFSYHLLGDMDSGGWPKRGRDKAVDIARRCFAFHICGDQHLCTLVQYGIDEQRDAGWVFCTPAISVGYQRWFRPDELNMPVINRPKLGHPNTGEYEDIFGNKMYVYAVGNPPATHQHENRYLRAQQKASGFGLITFNKSKRTIKSEAFRFLTGEANTMEGDQYPGWPHTIHQDDNYGRKATFWLPTLKISGIENPVVEIVNAKGKTEYIKRIVGNTFIPGVFEDGEYIIKVGNPDIDNWKTLKAKASKEKNGEELVLKFTAK